MKSSLSVFLRGIILWAALGLVGLPGKSFGQVLVSFGFTGGEQTWVVPSGINSIHIEAAGGGGGGGLDKVGSGGGGATSIIYRLGSGDTLWMVAVLNRGSARVQGRFANHTKARQRCLHLPALPEACRSPPNLEAIGKCQRTT